MRKNNNNNYTTETSPIHFYEKDVIDTILIAVSTVIICLAFTYIIFV